MLAVSNFLVFADVLQKLSFYHQNYVFIQSYLICGSIMCVKDKDKWRKSDGIGWFEDCEFISENSVSGKSGENSEGS